MRLCFILIFFSLCAQAQDYVAYHRRVSQIRNLVVEKAYAPALAHYDTIRDQFDFVFANDCFRALQLAIELKDDERSKFWLKKSFSSSIPFWYFKINEITSAYIGKMDEEKVMAMFEDAHRKYLASVNVPLRKTVDSLLEIDQRYTDKVNDGFWLFRGTIYNWRMKNNNRKQHPVLIDLIERFGYPGEKLIGLKISDDSNAIRYYQFQGPDFTEGRVYIMLIHCYSDPLPAYHGLFRKEVQKGNMSPENFAMICDFIAKYGKGKYGDFGYYNFWHQDPDKSHIPDIDKRRKEIGLSSFETQQSIRKRIISYRKDKIVNREISVY